MAAGPLEHKLETKPHTQTHEFNTTTDLWAARCIFYAQIYYTFKLNARSKRIQISLKSTKSSTRHRRQKEREKESNNNNKNTNRKQFHNQKTFSRVASNRISLLATFPLQKYFVVCLCTRYTIYTILLYRGERTRALAHAFVHPILWLLCDTKKAANIPFRKRGCESPWGIYFPLRVRKHTKTHSFSNTMHICTLRHSRSERATWL